MGLHVLADRLRLTAPYTNLPSIIDAWNAAPGIAGVDVCLATSQGAAASGSMLKAALNVNHPLEAVAVPAGRNPMLPRFMSLASVVTLDLTYALTTVALG